MMRAQSFVLLAIPLLILAGCAQTTPPTTDTNTTGPGPYDDTTWAARALPDQSDGHDHRDWTQHRGLSTPNFHKLAHDPLGIPAYGNRTAGGYFCGGQATTAEGRHITVISSLDTAVAFVVVDTTDPANPIHLGDYFLDYAQVYDVDVTPDGKHAVVGANVALDGKQPAPQSLGVSNPVTLRQSFRDACTGEIRQGPDQTVAAGPSTILVSLADPTNPTFEDIVPAPVIGPHSVSTALINGATYVASSTTNLQHQGSYYQFFQLQALPTGTKLVLVSQISAGQYGEVVEDSGSRPMPVLLNGHIDAEIAVHPVTEKPVVYLSNWDGGLVVLDFSIPQAPVLLGTWHDAGPSNGQLHSTLSLPGTHNGRHYVLAGQEFIAHPSNRPSGWIYILDDTDPTDIKEVGRWTLPVDTQGNWGRTELFSTHYFRVLNDTVFVAMYHGGVWAFKLDFENPENMKEPPSVGVFVPDGGPQEGRKPTGIYDYAPFVLDLFTFPDGYLVIYDGLSGVYSVHYDAEHPMASPPPWPSEGKNL